MNLRTKVLNTLVVTVLMSIAFVGGKQYAVYKNPAEDWVHLEVLESGSMVVLHEQHLYEMREVVGEAQAVPFQEAYKREHAHVR